MQNLFTKEKNGFSITQDDLDKSFLILTTGVVSLNFDELDVIHGIDCHLKERGNIVCSIELSRAEIVKLQDLIKELIC